MRTPRGIQAKSPRESAFSVIELVVVMLIAAILMATLLLSSRGARTVAGESVVRSTALSYDVAIRKFQKAHGGRAPLLTAGGAGEWAGDRGPRESQAAVFYLRSIPESVGRQVAVTAGNGASTLTRAGEVRYAQLAGGSSWAIVAVWNGKIVCATGAELPQYERC